MLSSDEQSDRFLTAKDSKQAGGRRGKFVFCNVLRVLLNLLGIAKAVVDTGFRF